MKRFKYLFDFFAFLNNLTINSHKTDKFFDFSIVESLLKKEDKKSTIYKPRKYKSCPSCKKQVKDIPHHMRQVHSFSMQSAASITGQYGLREKIKKKSAKKDYHTYRQRSVDGCYKVVLHMPQHLKLVHKVFKETLFLQ